MMFPHPEEFARNCMDIISVKDDLAVKLIQAFLNRPLTTR